VMFSHDHVPLFFLSFFGRKIFYDIHDYPRSAFFCLRVLSRAIGLSVQTRGKVEALRRDFGVPAGKIVYWPNGTDVERFDIQLSSNEARVKLGLPETGKIVLYSGSLQRWKGAETFVAATALLPDAFVYIVGGAKDDIERFRFMIHESRIMNLVLVGQKPWSEIPVWLKAADVLVLPNTGREDISRFYTSPMKLFEYMASGRPIVASDIPSICEIVNETMVFFAEPDNPESFAAVIQLALVNSGEAHRRSECAREEVRKYTWEARARKILAAMQAGYNSAGPDRRG